MKTWKIAALSTLAVGVLVSGCGTTGSTSSSNTASNTSSTSGNATTSSSASGKTIGFAVSTLNNPFFVAMQNGVQSEAKKDGLKVTVENGNNDAATQLNQVQDLIQQHVSAILLNPVDSNSLSSAVKLANQANIPVITLDRSVNFGKVATFIASDSVEAGKEAADQLIKALGGKGQVVELQGTIGASSEIDREKGFDQEIATAPGIKVVAKQTANFDRNTALNVMQNILQAHPDINGVFAQNDEMALGALKAIQQSGKKGIDIVGIDGEQEAITDVNNGLIYADIAQQPTQEGILGVDNAVKLINGQSVPKTVSSPLQLVTKGSSFKGF
ncbi:hypothetical protein AAC03nite_02440 [Alicyclobacillus acidoterrestris]|uniref:substrate-binding domain-containing protein n=1 Tax=Alicyclobacillus suci TaxID=2816080 RepID=UPI0011964364|nr:substrate-binding domain-containing protein [Alicyclobacillus suci]GEO24459.1 hypothetical protein AAC03nite_02440 [Alicyclobacillus acidoterrestris]